MTDKRAFDTRLIHSGETPRYAGAVTTPIFQSATFEYYGDGRSVGQADSPEALRYIRLNNTPNHDGLHTKLASLGGAEDALVTASGMAAISTTLLTFLSQGDHLLIQPALYGGTSSFAREDLPRFGIEVDYIDPQDPADWQSKVRPNTRVIYLETLSNPLTRLPELERAVEFAREHDLVSMIDNTFPSPFNCRPIEHGIDISLHSATKYLNGHSDIVAGVVLGKREHIERVRHQMVHLGGTLDPNACFLLNRGIKTLAVRMRHHNMSAMQVARFLEGHEKVERVHYPGLESHPDHDRCRELLDGFGGMLCFELRGGLATAQAFLSKTELAFPAPSLGGVETLVTLPATTSHLAVPPQERLRLGVTDSLVRMSVGLEAPEDLIADFDRAIG